MSKSMLAMPKADMASKLTQYPTDISEMKFLMINCLKYKWNFSACLATMVSLLV